MADNSLADVISLSRLKGVNVPFMTLLREKGISASEFLAMSPEQKGKILELDQIPNWTEEELREAKAVGIKEAEFCSKHNIKIISPILDGFPRRVEILDYAPTLLFVLGDADLDALHIIGIVGTRKITPQGTKFCQNFVKELGELVANPVIVSGLAYGTDSIAHQAALDSQLPTVAVLAHGLSMIYPASHRQLARNIINSGGALVTEYLSEEKPFKGHFLERNRIIAALSDGILVVESAIKGGAMSTAHASFDYSRTVMAVPGRPSDSMSQGCNHLIRKQIAVLTENAQDACEALGWQIRENELNKTETSGLFREPTEELLPLYRLIQNQDNPIGIDFLTLQLGVSPARISAMLFTLEEEGFVTRLPNNRYTII